MTSSYVFVWDLSSTWRKVAQRTEKPKQKKNKTARTELNSPHFRMTHARSWLSSLNQGHVPFPPESDCGVSTREWIGRLTRRNPLLLCAALPCTHSLLLFCDLFLYQSDGIRSHLCGERTESLWKVCGHSRVNHEEEASPRHEIIIWKASCRQRLWSWDFDIAASFQFPQIAMFFFVLGFCICYSL